MNQTLKSNLNIEDNDQNSFNEFTSIIIDILNNNEYKKLDLYTQHLNTSRLQHCINVAYYTYKMSKSLKLDYISATRGAMLHDFFVYDWQEVHSFNEHKNMHPKVSLENAKKYFEINNIMEDCILNHMWPATNTKPKTMEGHIVQIADKYSATVEVSKQSYRFVKGKTLNILAYITK